MYTAICPNSPTGKHCFCNVPTVFWSVIPPVPSCCWCGQSQPPEHGPYKPRLTGNFTLSITYYPGIWGVVTR